MPITAKRGTFPILKSESKVMAILLFLDLKTISKILQLYTLQKFQIQTVMQLKTNHIQKI